MNIPTTKRPELSAETKAAHETMIQGRAPSTWQFVPEELKPPPAGGAARSPNTSALGSLPSAAVVDGTDSQATPADKVEQMVGCDRLCVLILLAACPAATMAGRVAAAPTSNRLIHREVLTPNLETGTGTAMCVCRSPGHATRKQCFDVHKPSK